MGVVLPYGELYVMKEVLPSIWRTLGNTSRFEEGEFFVDKLSWMYLQDSRMAVLSNHLNM